MSSQDWNLREEHVEREIITKLNYLQHIEICASEYFSSIPDIDM